MKLELRKESSSFVREQGLVPGVIYGSGLTTTNVQVDLKELAKKFSDNGLSQTFDIKLKNRKHTVQFREIQRDPLLSDRFIHFDLYKIS